MILSNKHDHYLAKKLTGTKDELDLALKILNCTNDAFVFGGFVRTIVSNQESTNDIDLVLNTSKSKLSPEKHAEEEIGKFRQKLLEANIDFEKCTDVIDSYDDKTNKIYHQILSVKNNGNYYKIDVIVHLDNKCFENIDFNINCLKLTKDGKIKAAEGFSYEEIISSIREKKLRVINGTKKRLDKFAELGYTQQRKEDLLKETNNKQNNIKTEKKNMSTLVDNTKGDLKEAGKRIAAKQFSKLVKAGLLKLLVDKKAVKGKAHQKAIQEILDSPFGDAAVQMAIGQGLTFIPGLKDDPRCQVFAKEFRVQSFETAGNEVADLLSSLMPMVTGILDSLPAIEEQKEVVSLTNDNKKSV